MQKLSKSVKIFLVFGFIIGFGLLTFLSFSSIGILEDIMTPEPPHGFNKFFVIKKKNNDKNTEEYEFKVDKPTIFQFFVSPNFHGEKTVKFVSPKRIIGLYTNEITILEGNYGNSQVSLLLTPATYKFLVDFQIKGASIYFYTNIYIPDNEYVERLVKIDSGNIYNPPKGYREIFRTNLSKLNVNNLSIAKFTIQNSGNYGICAYSTKSKGKFSLKLVGGGYKGVDLLNEGRLFSDQIFLYLPPSSYEILLSSYEAHANIVIYLTNY